MEMEELVVERLKCHNPSVDPTKIFLAPRCSKRGKSVTVPDIILHLHRDDGKLLVEGDSRSISHLLLKMGITCMVRPRSSRRASATRTRSTRRSGSERTSSAWPSWLASSSPLHGLLMQPCLCALHTTT